MDLSESESAEEKRDSRWSGGAPLLLAAALVSMSDGVLMVGLPFLVIARGASAAQVGLVGGLMKVAYVAGLLSGRPLLGRFHLPRLAAVGCLGLAGSTLAMPNAPGLGWLLILVAFYGLATSLFWPPVVGLLSAGLHGRSLNQRLGRFNMAWSGGMVVGPWLGGALFSVSPGLPFRVAAGMFAVGMAAMFSLSRMRPKTDVSPSRAADESPESSRHGTGDCAPVFRQMARIALIGGYIVLGLLRYQLPNLAKEAHIDEATFGAIGTLLSLSLAGAFFLLGKAAGWHYRAGLLWVGQAIMAASLLIPAMTARVGHLLVSVLIAGQTIGLVYASHLFYGTTAGRDRARVMSVHEILLSLGFLVGSFGGGLVAEMTDDRAVYAVGCGVILLGVALQLGLRLLGGLGRAAMTADRSGASTPGAK